MGGEQRQEEAQQQIGLLIVSFQFFLCNCQHQLYAVFLVHMGRRRVIVDGHYIRIGGFLRHCPDHALCTDMVG